jgi:hypothetical protein
MNVNEFLKEALEPQPQMRKGQHFINRLTVVKPWLSYKLQQTGLDPYYVDSKLPAAIQYTVENWDLF